MKNLDQQIADSDVNIYDGNHVLTILIPGQAYESKTFGKLPLISKTFTITIALLPQIKNSLVFEMIEN